MAGSSRFGFALALLCLSASVAAAPCAGFTDVEDTDLFCPNVAWLKNRNITLGCEASLYCPSAPVSRLAMAAFLNRLGNVLLPPNVVWVAPVGGQFQSIQAAIDHVVAHAGFSPSLVKVAPGAYLEQLTIPANVRVEGSGRGVTEIRAQGGCAAAPATAGAVTLHENAQLSRMHVSLFSTAPADCAAVLIVNGAGTPLHDVLVRIEGDAAVKYGVRLAGGSIDHPVMLDNVEVRANAGFGSSSRAVGVALGGSVAHEVLLRDVSISAGGPDAVGLLVGDIGVRMDRTRISAFGTALAPPTALSVTSTTGMLIENGALQAIPAGRAIDQAAGGTLRIATSLLDGSITGTTSCFATYGPTMGPVAC